MVRVGRLVVVGECLEDSPLLVPEFGGAHGTGDEQTQMTGRETHHMHLSGEFPGQSGTDPGLESCQAPGIAQQAAERPFPRRGETGAGSAITTPGTAAGFIGRHGISPA